MTPVELAPIAPNAKMTPASASNKRLRVLVVEDSEQIAMCVEEALIDAGYVVIGPVGRLKAAVSLAQTEALDAAVVDLDLYGESSLPVLEALNQRAVPFVVATAYDIHQTKLRFSNRPWLSKPYSLNVMLTELRALTGERMPD
ncbi:MAG: hypothetical protein JWR16_1839 [Nevskia sp.]|nr:hypothetical protein [Nevskia sp.]